MGNYRKKPVVIEAIKLEKGMKFPEWLTEAQDNGGVCVRGTDHILRDEPMAEINTLEGTMIAQKGDYIIKGVKGEIYPCKPDIFEMTYEEVE